MAGSRPRVTASAGSTSSTSTTSAAPITFADLGVSAPLTRALAAGGVTMPFPIQAATLPDALAGRDVLGRGRTGSGKTFAFALPLLSRLAASAAPRRSGRPRALILAPTRELASQIEAAIAPLARALSLRTLTVFGGVSPGPQISGLRAGVDVLVACPGRLADHLRSGRARLDAVEVTVLDEADHMADLGFLPVVRDLLEQTPRSGQRLLFSATLDAQVDVLVRRFLTNPVTHHADPPSGARDPKMAHHVLHVTPDDRLSVLIDLAAAPGRTLVFARTKHRAKQLTRRLVSAGVPAVELHGNLAQTARSRNLLAFSEGRATTLVATDIAARGIHVDDVALVVHADPPVEHKAYLHRSGRTARAGAAGTVVTLMTDEQVGDVRKLARAAGVAPTTTRLRPGDPLLASLAPGRRTFVTPSPAVAQQPADRERVGRARAGRARAGWEPAGREPAESGMPGGGGPRRRRGRGKPATTVPPGASSRSGSSGRGRTGARISTQAGSVSTSAAAFSTRTPAGTRRGGRIRGGG